MLISFLELNRPISTSNSVYNSRSDLTSIPKKSRGSSITSLESTNKQLNDKCKLLSNRFDLMLVINRFYIDQVKHFQLRIILLLFLYFNILE